MHPEDAGILKRGFFHLATASIVCRCGAFYYAAPSKSFEDGERTPCPSCHGQGKMYNNEEKELD